MGFLGRVEFVFNVQEDFWVVKRPHIFVFVRRWSRMRPLWILRKKIRGRKAKYE